MVGLGATNHAGNVSGMDPRLSLRSTEDDDNTGQNFRLR